MKNYLLILLIINFFTLGCENQKNITDDQVIEVVREFFDAFDIENEDRNENLSRLVTDDFILCELGKFYKLDEFLEFVDPLLSSTISTKWTLSDHKVTIDNNIAHSFHNNSGVFTDVYENGVKKIDIIRKATFSLENNFFSSRRSKKNKHNDYGRNISAIMIK